MQDSCETTDLVLASARFMRAVGYDLDSWRAQAACNEVDPGLFFPVGASGEALAQHSRAKAICAGCPVRHACLRFALATNQQYGIWGGYDEDERREIRRRSRAAAGARRSAERTSRRAAAS